MARLRTFFSLTLLGGLTVVLPIVCMVVLAQWLYALTSDLLAPFTSGIQQQTGTSELLAIVWVVGIILVVCFVIGLFVRTQLGQWFHQFVDRWLVKWAPGYKTIREVVTQLFGNNNDASIFNGQPCLARLFGIDSPTQVTAIITSHLGDGRVTVFVPTAPIPTSGLTYHLPNECVEVLHGVSVEEVMRTIISCGTGTDGLLTKAGAAKAAN